MKKTNQILENINKIMDNREIDILWEYDPYKESNFSTYKYYYTAADKPIDMCIVAAGDTLDDIIEMVVSQIEDIYNFYLNLEHPSKRAETYLFLLREFKELSVVDFEKFKKLFKLNEITDAIEIQVTYYDDDDE